VFSTQARSLIPRPCCRNGWSARFCWPKHPVSLDLPRSPRCGPVLARMWPRANLWPTQTLLHLQRQHHTGKCRLHSRLSRRPFQNGMTTQGGKRKGLKGKRQKVTGAVKRRRREHGVPRQHHRAKSRVKVGGTQTLSSMQSRKNRVRVGGTQTLSSMKSRKASFREVYPVERRTSRGAGRGFRAVRAALLARPFEFTAIFTTRFTCVGSPLPRVNDPVFAPDMIKARTSVLHRCRWQSSPLVALRANFSCPTTSSNYNFTNFANGLATVLVPSPAALPQTACERDDSTPVGGRH